MRWLQNSKTLIAQHFKIPEKFAMRGVECHTADRRESMCQFILANYICDLPEIWDISGLEVQNSSLPCSRRFVQRDIRQFQKSKT